MNHEKEIFIICNSPEALHSISSGIWPHLHERNIFTCNNAYTFFRTSGRHLNIFTDLEDILRFKLHPEGLHLGYQEHVEFIFSDPMGVNSQAIGTELKFTSNQLPCSSGIGALWHLSEVENFQVIHLIGYTMNEWDFEKSPRYAPWKNQWEKFYSKYDVVNRMYPSVYKFTKK